MAVIKIFLLIIFMLPFYGLLIYGYFNPENSMLFGRRWMYEEEPELSEEAIQWHKLSSIFFIIVLTLFLLMSIYKSFL